MRSEQQGKDGKKSVSKIVQDEMMVGIFVSYLRKLTQGPSKLSKP